MRNWWKIRAQAWRISSMEGFMACDSSRLPSKSRGVLRVPINGERPISRFPASETSAMRPKTFLLSQKLLQQRPIVYTGSEERVRRSGHLRLLFLGNFPGMAANTPFPNFQNHVMDLSEPTVEVDSRVGLI